MSINTNRTQIIFVCDHYEIADSRNSEVPEWPVQDRGGRWHRPGFIGQRVAYDRDGVEFGLLVAGMSDPEVSTLDMDDLPNVVYIVGDDFYRAI